MYKESVHQISMLGAGSSEEDSLAVLLAQARLDTLRFEILESAKLDIREASEAAD